MKEAYLNNDLGRYVNRNYAEYHIPVNVGIRKIDVVFVGAGDDIASPIGVKGGGKIGMLGVSAANAVHHATGKRGRKLPLTIGCGALFYSI